MGAIFGLAGCGSPSTCSEGVPSARTIDEGDEIYMAYRAEGERRMTDRAGDVPLGQRSAVVVRSPDGRFSPPPTETGEERLYLLDLTEAPSGRPYEARLATRAKLKALRAAGNGGVSAGQYVAGRVEDVGPRLAADPLLWEVESPNGSVYLFATLHYTDRGELEELAPQVQEAFRASDRFVMEADVDEVGWYAQKKGVRTYPPGTSLQEKLGPEAWQQLLEERHGYPPKVLRRLRPWVLVLQMSLLQRGRSKESMDIQLRDWSLALDKEVGFLESAKDHVSAIRRGFGLEALRRLLLDDDGRQVRPGEIQRVYEAGDLEQLERLVLEESDDLRRGTPAYEALLAERNRAWAKTLKSHIRQGDVFVAAGAAHFVGPDSLILLLREDGYLVRRVP